METDKLTNSSNTGLQKITTQLAVSNKLLLQIDSKRVMRLLLRHPYFAAYAVLKINPLDYRLLTQVAIANKEIFDPWNMWYTLPVDENLMEENIDQINWDYISINHNFPFIKTFIEKYKDYWDWYGLSSNINLNPNLIDIFKESWVWGHLSGNVGSFWTKELINKHITYWNWSSLSGNASLPFSTEFIKEFENYWDWDNLSSNDAIPWSLDLIDTFKERWNWNILTNYQESSCPIIMNKFPWSIEGIRKFDNYWDWDVLSANEDIPLTVELIGSFLDKWNWSLLSSLGNNRSFSKKRVFNWSEELIEAFKYKWDWRNLSRNNDIPWSISILNKFKEFLDFEGLCEQDCTTLSFSKDFIIENEDKWDWGTLSSQFNVKWDKELIEKYEDRWDWQALSYNSRLPWNIYFIEKYLNRWDWEALSFNGGVGWNAELISRFNGKFKMCRHDLSDNGKLYVYYYIGGLNRSEGQSLIEVIEFFNGDIGWNEVGQNNAPWSIPFIEKYKDKINWSSFSKNTYIQWSDDLLYRFQDYWDWSELGHNSSLPLTIELLEKFEEKWIWGIFNDNVLKIFEQFFSDDFVETLLVNIISSFDKKEA